MNIRKRTNSQEQNVAMVINGQRSILIISNFTTTQWNRQRRDYNHCDLINEETIIRDYPGSKC